MVAVAQPTPCHRHARGVSMQRHAKCHNAVNLELIRAMQDHLASIAYMHVACPFDGPLCGTASGLEMATCGGTHSQADSAVSLTVSGTVMA